MWARKSLRVWRAFRLVEFMILIVSRVKLIPLQNNERRFMIHDLEFTPHSMQ